MKAIRINYLFAYPAPPKFNMLLQHTLAVVAILIFSVGIAQKRKLEPDDYSQWNSFMTGGFSDDGAWVSYSRLYAQGKDTLFLKNCDNGKLYGLPGGKNGVLSKDNKWFVYRQNTSAILIDTRTGFKSDLGEGSDYCFTGNSRQLVMRTPAGMAIYDLYSANSSTAQGVTEFTLNRDAGLITYIQQDSISSSVYLTDIGKGMQAQLICTTVNNTYRHLQWDNKGTAFSFFESADSPGGATISPKIYFCSGIGKKRTLAILDLKNYPEFDKKFRIEESVLIISEKQDQVFFDMACVSGIERERDIVSIWHTEDNQAPSGSGCDTGTNWFVWFPTDIRIIKIDDDRLENPVLTGDERYAMLFDKTPYLPQHKFTNEYVDVYLKELRTGTTTLVCKKQLQESKQIFVSPAGKFIIYFKDKQWWQYQIASQKHNCITCKIKSAFEKTEYDWAGIAPPYGVGGWSENDESVYLYDHFDIWKFRTSGPAGENITAGKKKGIRYRFATGGPTASARDSFFLFTSRSINSKVPIVLSLLDEKTLDEGYGFYSEGKGILNLTMKNMKMNLLQKTPDNSHLLVMESSFERAPEVIRLDSNGSQTLICRTNRQQDKFYWGKSELRHFSTEEGDVQKSALFYPANYIAGRKYPLIVYIYERMSGELNTYVKPSSQNRLGFNATNYTADGYFVLYPDIKYELNAPGASALKCVMAAVDDVVATEMIDPEKIGLVGHSFGGYETAYIISHCDRFRVAVAGAPITDLQGWYLSWDGYQKSNIWRFENQQFRLQSPFYSTEFLENSPILNIQDINTPVLIWTASTDKQVDWTNSLKLYTGLWRLGKQSTLLIYPDDEHILLNPNHQQDLTLRMRDWLAKYLK